MIITHTLKNTEGMEIHTMDVQVNELINLREAKLIRQWGRDFNNKAHENTDKFETEKVTENLAQDILDGCEKW